MGPWNREQEEGVPGRNNTEQQNWHRMCTSEDVRQQESFSFMILQAFIQDFLLAKCRFFNGCRRTQDVYLAFKTQHKELQICTWGLKATAVPIHTQSKSRDKYESEKEKLQGFVQVLSTFTHAEDLYLSKLSHWLQMWVRITCMEQGYWIWSLR